MGAVCKLFILLIVAVISISADQNGFPNLDQIDIPSSLDSNVLKSLQFNDNDLIRQLVKNFNPGEIFGEILDQLEEKSDESIVQKNGDKYCISKESLKKRLSGFVEWNKRLLGTLENIKFDEAIGEPAAQIKEAVSIQNIDEISEPMKSFMKTIFKNGKKWRNKNDISNEKSDSNELKYMS